MEKTTIIGKNLEYDGRSYDVGSVTSIAMLREGIALTFRDGSHLLADVRPEEYYTLADLCPWAEKVPTY